MRWFKRLLPSRRAGAAALKLAEARKRAVDEAGRTHGVPLALARSGRQSRDLFILHDHLQTQGVDADTIRKVLCNPVLVDRFFSNRGPDGTIRDAAAEQRFLAWVHIDPTSGIWPG